MPRGQTIDIFSRKTLCSPKDPERGQKDYVATVMVQEGRAERQYQFYPLSVAP